MVAAPSPAHHLRWRPGVPNPHRRGVLVGVALLGLPGGQGALYGLLALCGVTGWPSRAGGGLGGLKRHVWAATSPVARGPGGLRPMDLLHSRGNGRPRPRPLRKDRLFLRLAPPNPTSDRNLSGESSSDGPGAFSPSTKVIRSWAREKVIAEEMIRRRHSRPRRSPADCSGEGWRRVWGTISRSAYPPRRPTEGREWSAIHSIGRTPAQLGVTEYADRHGGLAPAIQVRPITSYPEA